MESNRVFITIYICIQPPLENRCQLRRITVIETVVDEWRLEPLLIFQQAKYMILLMFALLCWAIFPEYIYAPFMFIWRGGGCWLLPFFSVSKLRLRFYQLLSKYLRHTKECVDLSQLMSAMCRKQTWGRIWHLC